jgi:glycosyltransferase involved in cell wall biosynthesis
LHFFAVLREWPAEFVYEPRLRVCMKPNTVQLQKPAVPATIRRMAGKLCYVCEATEGGVRKHLLQLFRVFSSPREGWEVHAIMGDRGEPGLREELAELSAAAPAFQHTFLPQMRRPVRPWRDMRAYARLKEIMRGIAPDIVHTHSSKAGVLGREAAFRLGIRNVLHTPHVFPFQWARGLSGRVYLAIERQLARHTRKLVCVGESQCADALSRGVAPAGKMIVIRNGIELPEPVSAVRRAELRLSLGIQPDAPTVGMVARLAPQKGVGMFVRAAARVLQKRPETVFLMVGGGPLESEVRARATELGLPPEKFRMLGHRADTAALYPAFDLLALSSLYEGLPYVLLEAMACGVPVVATDVLGSRDVVDDGVTGLLARVSDPGHIAERILLLLNDPPNLRRCGVAARERVAAEFSFQSFIAAHRTLYAE